MLSFEDGAICDWKAQGLEQQQTISRPRVSLESCGGDLVEERLWSID
jgi:hypothetical protein